MNIEDFEIEGTVLKKYKGDKWSRNVIIPSGITEIEENTFKEFENIKSVQIPESLIKIGACAFEGCRGLESVNLPESLIEIGDFAFYRCYKLKNINIPKKITLIQRKENADLDRTKDMRLLIAPLQKKVNQRKEKTENYYYSFDSWANEFLKQN